MPLSKKQQEQRLSWLKPPGETLPGVTAVERVLAQNDQAAVYLGSVAGYPLGFEINMIIVCSADDIELDSLLLGSAEWLHKEHGGDPGGSADLFRFGLRFADGTTGSSAELARGMKSRGKDGRPTQPLIMLLNGHGTEGKYELRYWVSPIPPAGQLVLDCEWLGVSLERTQVEIDAKAIREASARAKVIFSEE